VYHKCIGFCVNFFLPEFVNSDNITYIHVILVPSDNNGDGTYDANYYAASLTGRVMGFTRPSVSLSVDLSCFPLRTSNWRTK